MKQFKRNNAMYHAWLTDMLVKIAEVSKHHSEISFQRSFEVLNVCLVHSLIIIAGYQHVHLHIHVHVSRKWMREREREKYLSSF